ncbi:hypothetical protein C8Q76DRAFT_790595 [Earliella scabrosa]|nr:hypothetical protein C8Q76DRAFT_790595 [Earliella scabrosa]
MASPACYHCEKAEFSSTVDRGDFGRALEVWVSAKVFINELTEGNKWLMVVVENQSTPVIWRVIQEGYPITTDERSRTIAMQQVAASQGSIVEKLRFDTPRDFWSCVAYLTSSCVFPGGSSVSNPGYTVPTIPPGNV